MTYCRAVGLMVAMALIAPMAAAQGVSPILKELEDTFVRLGEELRPWVVNIEVRSTVASSREGVPFNEDLFRFFGLTPDDEEEVAPQNRIPTRASGSGFIVDRQGHIVTNNHVVRDANGIDVTLLNGKEYEATVVGTDPQTDIAIIKIESDEPLPSARLGNSDSIKPGQFAIAVGSPNGLEGSLSFGHITALGRENLTLPDPDLRFQGFIQTDAAINLGNSGGPLCNINGEVIGINIAIVYGANSLGFAIPINTAKTIIEQLIAEGRVVRGYLGVEIEDAANFVNALELLDDQGAFVQNVLPGTPAEKGGIVREDVIRKVDGEPIDNAVDLMRTVSGYSPGDRVDMEIWRNGQLINREITLEAFPETDSVARAVEENSLGIRVQEIPADLVEELELPVDDGGVIVSRVKPDSPAFHAGMRQGDIVLEIAREPVDSIETFDALVEKHGQPGNAFVMRIVRRGENPRTVPVEIPGNIEE